MVNLSADKLYPENQIFWNTIFRLHALQNDQVLLAYTPPGMGAPPTIFFQKGVKNLLKI